MRSVMVVVVDLALMLLATVLAFLLRQNSGVNWTQFDELIPYLIVTLVVGSAAVFAFGAGRSMWRHADSGEYIRVMLVSLVTVVLSLVLSFWMFRLNHISRSLPPLQIALMSFFLIGARILARHSFAAKQKASSDVRGSGVADIPHRGLEIVLGLNAITELYLRSLDEIPGGAGRIAGLLSVDSSSVGRKMGSHTVLGTPVELSRLLLNLENHGVVVDRIVITEDIHALDAEARAELSAIELSRSIELIHLRDVLQFENGRTAREISKNQSIADDSAICIGEQQVVMALKRPYWHFKRAFDVIVASALILLLLPLFLLVAALVLINVGSPILFWQRRPGRFAQPITVIKFRTMRGTFDPDGNRIPEHLRLSALGRMLRAVRLDELPQLIHILRGDMSFIGPRPLLPVDQSPEMAARLMVRPGLTGWAQVHGGTLVTPADKAAMDLWYITNVSFAIEARIVLLTIKMLLFGQKQNTQMVEAAWRGLNHFEERRSSAPDHQRA